MGDKTTTLTSPSAEGSYYYGACVDQSTEEIVGQNNCSAGVKVEVRSGAPDLGIETLWWDEFNSNIEAGEWLLLAVSVENSGDVGSSLGEVTFYRSTDSTITADDMVVDTKEVGRLEPSESSFLAISAQAPDERGAYFFGACVSLSVGETNSQNNCTEGSVLVIE